MFSTLQSANLHLNRVLAACISTGIWRQHCSSSFAGFQPYFVRWRTCSCIRLGSDICESNPLQLSIYNVEVKCGNFQEGGSSAAPVLRQVEVEVVDRISCYLSYLGLNTVTNQMVCAGVPEGGRDACQVRVFLDKTKI